MPRILLTLLLAAGAAYAVVSATRDDTEKAAQASTVASPIIDPEAAPAQIPRKPPVLLLVLDEFPIDLMLGPDGKIDSVRYPSFAALAATGTWFKNAHTVYDSTTKATPAVFDGKLPKPRTKPTYEGHPRTVFDLFGRRGYRIVKSEEATSLCPPRYCPGARKTRPAILPLLQRGRRERLQRFFDRIRPGKPTFYAKHVLLPHGPYQYLPSGKQTRNGYQDPVPGMNSPPGFGDRFLTQHNQQRLQLQIGYTDRQLGRLFSRMVANGTFDDALIVITSDHGFAFEVGVKDRRTVTRSNIDEIAPVPLFVKAPGQRRGRTSAAYVRTTDIVPTMADVLNFKMPYRADGRSAFSRAVTRRRFVRMIRRKFNGTITVSARRMEARRRANVRAKLSLFGSGDIRSLYTGIGPNRHLIGRNAADQNPLPLGSVRASISGAANLRAVRPSSVLLPTQIAGPVRGGRRGAKRDIAVAVNGRIEAVGRTFYLRGSRQESFAVNVPEASLKPGRNAVEVFQLSRGRLQLIGRA